MYPNPTRNMLHIDFIGLNSELSVTILDVNGQVLYRKRLTNQSSEVHNVYDMSSYPAGVYFVRIVSTDEVHVQRIIKQ
ncbi:MAG: T9SS type A sorting domain-containing protein, partial [Bacteroidetes bacterium]|nr:T9SS type A sorting domain-containing protein [Bacteroidota bacterium]